MHPSVARRDELRPGCASVVRMGGHSNSRATADNGSIYVLCRGLADEDAPEAMRHFPTNQLFGDWQTMSANVPVAGEGSAATRPAASGPGGLLADGLIILNVELQPFVSLHAIHDLLRAFHVPEDELPQQCRVDWFRDLLYDNGSRYVYRGMYRPGDQGYDPTGIPLRYVSDPCPPPSSFPPLPTSPSSQLPPPALELSGHRTAASREQNLSQPDERASWQAWDHGVLDGSTNGPGWTAAVTQPALSLRQATLMKMVQEQQLHQQQMEMQHQQQHQQQMEMQHQQQEQQQQQQQQ